MEIDSDISDFYYSDEEDEEEEQEELIRMHINVQESSFPINKYQTPDDVILQIKCVLTCVDKKDYNTLLHTLLSNLHLSKNQRDYAKHIFKKTFNRIGKRNPKFTVQTKENVGTRLLVSIVEKIEKEEDDFGNVHEKEIRNNKVLCVFNENKVFNYDWFSLQEGNNDEETEEGNDCIIL